MPRDFARLVLPRLEAAVAALELESVFHTIELCTDDLAGAEDAWYHFLPPITDDPRAGVTVYCALESFCAETSGGRGLLPGRAIWEQPEASPDEPGIDRYSAAATDRMVHHSLLLGADLAAGEVSPATLPRSLSQAFQAAWSVTVDGRLERKGLPGYSMRLRRARFSGLFSASGVLLPGHWAIFQSLWDGALTTPGEVLAACRRLPGLGT